MNIRPRIRALERHRPRVAHCAECGGKGRFAVRYINPLPGMAGSDEPSGCPSCGRRSIITVTFVKGAMQNARDCA